MVCPHFPPEHRLHKWQCYRLSHTKSRQLKSNENPCSHRATNRRLNIDIWWSHWDSSRILGYRVYMDPRTQKSSWHWTCTLQYVSIRCWYRYQLRDSIAQNLVLEAQSNRTKEIHDLTLVRMGEISKLAIKGRQRNIDTYAIPEHLKSINRICPWMHNFM
jgi:hypothetical protein